MFVITGLLFVLFILILRDLCVNCIHQIHVAQYKYKGYDESEYYEMMQRLSMDEKNSNDKTEKIDYDSDVELETDSEEYQHINKTY